MKVYPIQSRFSAGEISPKLYSRADIEGYASGVKTLSNFVALRHGSIERRPGTKIMALHDGYRGRMFEFPISETESYAVVLMNDGKMYVDNREGNLLGASLGSNPDFRNNMDNWTDYSIGLGHANYIDGEVVACSGGSTASDQGRFGQAIVIADPSAEKILHVEAEKLRGNSGLIVRAGLTLGAMEIFSATMVAGQTDLFFSLDTSSMAINDSLYVSVEVAGCGTAECQWAVDRISLHERYGDNLETVLNHPYNIDDLEGLQMEMEPGANKSHFTTGRKIPHTLDYNDGAWTFLTTKFKGRPGDWTGYVDFDAATAGVEKPEIGAIVEYLTNVYRFRGVETNLAAATYTDTAVWEDKGIADIFEDRIDYDTDGGTRYMSPGTTVKVLDSTPAIVGTIGNVYAFIGSYNLGSITYPTDPAWEDKGLTTTYVATQNFPGSIAFFGGRSWWAGFPETQDTFFGSRSSLYLDMELGSALDDDGVQATMSDHGLIQWIRGEQDLLIGSKNGEYVITAEGGPITPSDIQVQKQSANGSRKMQGEPIGNSVAYTSLDGSKIRDMEYKFVVNGWQSLDISFTAEHMFSMYGKVKEIHYAKDPESIIWFITEEGNVIGCTFDPANQVIGWHRHPTDGVVISACIQKHKGVASLWLMVDRHISGANNVYIERATNATMMDASASVYQMTPTNQIASYPHLAMKTVNVKVDGVVADDVTLDANGDGTASITGNLIEVGIPFTATLETLSTEVPVKAGTAMGHIKRWNRVVARLYNSYIPKINGVRVDEVTPFSGDIDVVKLGWDTDASNTIEMELPQPCRVSGIFGELEENLA